MGSHNSFLRAFLATIYLVRDPLVAALSFPGRSALRALGGKHSYSGMWSSRGSETEVCCLVAVDAEYGDRRANRGITVGPGGRRRNRLGEIYAVIARLREIVLSQLIDKVRKGRTLVLNKCNSGASG